MTAADITAEAHRALAKQLFNKTWELIDLPDRSPDQDRLMLVQACAAWWHWDKVGTEQNRAIADWQVGHVASLLGHGDLALAFAGSALQRAESGELDDWVLASALEGVARAHAAAGHQAERDACVARARQALQQIGEDEERSLISGQIDSIPPASPAGT